MILNQQQLKACQITQRHVLVLAGAGSGKTRVITEKIAYLIQNQVAAESIWAVTFTNKAAREMRSRLKKNHAHLGSQVNIATFHTLGLTIIRQHATVLGYKNNFSIFDSNDSIAVLKELSANNEDCKAIKWQISELKNASISPELALQQAGDNNERQLAELYSAYQRQLLAYNALDFDDLIMQPLLLFANHAQILHQWQHKVRYLLVDEYQDTNACQYQLIKYLLGHTCRLTAVGDDAQSIYAWRGARVENLELLQAELPNLEVILLEQNYRSVNNILSCANALISHNASPFEKKLWSNSDNGELIDIIEAKNDADEAELVAMEILRQKLSTGAKNSDFAILYRSNFQSASFAKALRMHNLPYTISGGQDFFAQTEIKDAIAYARLIANSDDDAALLRIINTPRRAIGAASLEKLATLAKQREISLLDACSNIALINKLSSSAQQRVERFYNAVKSWQQMAEIEDAHQVLCCVLKDIDYHSWLQQNASNEQSANSKIKSIQELLDWLQNQGKRHLQQKKSPFMLADLVAKITLIDIMEQQNEAAPIDAVQLMTLHAAKGLEFPYVFLTGVEEDILPHHNSILDGKVDEERRLCYVGITRARQGLSISYAKYRKKAGQLVATTPSRFLDELDQNCIDDPNREQHKTNSQQYALEQIDLMRKILKQS